MTVVSYDGPRRHMTAVSYMDADGRHVVARAARAEFTEFRVSVFIIVYMQYRARGQRPRQEELHGRHQRVTPGRAPVTPARERVAPGRDACA